MIIIPGSKYDRIHQIRDEYYSHVLSTVFRLEDPHPIALHYTSGDSLISILDSEVFRLTNVRFMNDPTELKHSLDLLSDAIRPLRSGLLLRETAALEHIRDHVIPKLEERSSRQFILSLSLEQDSVDLWKSYGHDNGCAFEFDIPELIRTFDTKDAGLLTGGDYTYDRYSRFNGTLLYDPTLQQQFIRDSVAFATRLFEAGLGFSTPADIYEISDCLTSMTHVMYAGLYNMKSEKHSIEKEYRFVILPDPDYSEVLKRDRNGRTENYIEMKGLLRPLRRVWMGPYCGDSGRILKAIENYSRRHGITVPSIDSSVVP
jgi:hypothetical protein